jgi:hypothetical protein
VAGTPGTQPTNWVLSGLPAGVTSEVVGRFVVNGVNVLRLRLSGTPGSTTNGRLDPESLSAVSAAPGQTWTASVFLRLHAGSLANLAVNTRVQGRDVGLAAFDSVSTARTPTATLTRFATTTTLVNVGIIYATSDVLLGFTSGLAVDATLDVGWPQLEQGPFASTPILPPVSTPGASTRGTDNIVAPMASLGVSSQSPGITTLATVLIPVLPVPSPDSRMMLHIVEDAGGADAFAVFLNPATVESISIVGGGFAGPGSAGAPSANTLFRIGQTINSSTPRHGMSFNGAAVAAAVGGVTSALPFYRIGSRGTGLGFPMFGEIGTLRILRRAVSDAELQSLVSGL